MGLYKVYDKFRRYWRQIHMLTIRDGWKKMAYIKKHGMFGAVGENCYFQSNILPAEPFLVYLHDNVAISAGVRIVTHIMHKVVNFQISLFGSFINIQPNQEITMRLVSMLTEENMFPGTATVSTVFPLSHKSSVTSPPSLNTGKFRPIRFSGYSDSSFL